MGELQPPVGVNADDVFAFSIRITDFPCRAVVSRDAVQVGNDNVAVIDGNYCHVNGAFSVRGGISIIVDADYTKPGFTPKLPS